MDIKTYIIILILYIIVLWLGIAFYNQFVKLQNKLKLLNDLYESERRRTKSNKRFNSAMDNLAKYLDTENNRKRYEELDNVEKQLFDTICNIPYTDFKEVINNKVDYYIYETNYKGIKVEVLYCPQYPSCMSTTLDFAHKINGVMYRCATIGYIHGFIEHRKNVRLQKKNKYREEILQKL